MAKIDTALASASQTITEDEWTQRATRHLAALQSVSLEEAAEDLWKVQQNTDANDNNPELAVEAWLWDEVEA